MGKEIIKTLDIYRVWEILNLIKNYELDLEEQSIFIDILGNNSGYSEMPFSSFLDYYSFKLEKDKLCIFNDSPIPYEDYSTNDFSYLSLHCLDMSDKEIINFAGKIKESRLKEQAESKGLRKKHVLLEIERLKKELENL